LNTLTKKKPLESDFDNGRILIEDFRFYQHMMIEYFLEIVVNHISVMNSNHLTFNRVESEQIISYSGLSNNELIKYMVFVNVGGGVKEFFQVYLPKLMYNNFYFLNGNYYVPLFYIIDKPIIIKENSINLSSLFNSITMNFKSKMCIFTGRNIDLEIFISAFLYKDKDTDVINLIKSNINITDDHDAIVNYFSKILQLKFKDIDDIKDYSEKRFFDEYTKGLYDTCYSDDKHIIVDSLTDIIKISLETYFSGKIFNFIDLKNKRISFMELLLAPLFMKVASIANQVKKGYTLDRLNVDQYVVIKNFHKNAGKTDNKADFKSFHGLSGKTLYDLVNLYSSLLVHKCSFVKPGMKSPPRSIANIHDSHFGKICPITVSSINPGEMLSIIPEIFVDPYGQFLDL